MNNKQSIEKWEYDKTAKLIHIELEKASNTVTVHCTYTIRITEVGREKSKIGGTSWVEEEEEEEIRAKNLGSINVKGLHSYTCAPEL
jgi:hypothetical protein